MTENNNQNQQTKRTAHIVKTIGKTTYLVTCHFSEKSHETLEEKTSGGPWFNSRDFKKIEKKLYGRKAANIMSTDIKETDDSYEMVIDLPGFKKEDVRASFKHGIAVFKSFELITKQFHSNCHSYSSMYLSSSP